MKYLIINADDFGYSKIFNASILELIKKRLISSTSFMVNYLNNEQNEQIKELSVLSKSHNISIGLHVEFFDGNFRLEIERQYEKYFSIFGFIPSHIDLHKSTYLKEAYPIIMNFCEEKNLPCRNHNINGFANVLKTKNEVIDGTKINFNELKNMVENFKDGESYEIFFHPGYYDPDCKSSLNKKREDDNKKIEFISPLLKENNIELISYADLVNIKI